MRILPVIAAAFALAFLAAAITFAVAPPAVAPTAAIAVYGSVVSTVGISLAVRTALSDRPRLGLEIVLEGMYGDREQAPSFVVVRMFNAGRRPITIEGIGFWPMKSADATTFPWWDTWTDRGHVSHFPATLGESESLALHAAAAQIARWYVRHEPARFLFIKPSHGPRQWFDLDARTRGFLAGHWPMAAEQLRREEEGQAAKDAGLN